MPLTTCQPNPLAFCVSLDQSFATRLLWVAARFRRRKANGPQSDGFLVVSWLGPGSRQVLSKSVFRRRKETRMPALCGMRQLGPCRENHVQSKWMKLESEPATTQVWPGPPVVPLYPFLREGSRTNIDYRQKGTLVLTSLLE